MATYIKANLIKAQQLSEALHTIDVKRFHLKRKINEFIESSSSTYCLSGESWDKVRAKLGEYSNIIDNHELIQQIIDSFNGNQKIIDLIGDIGAINTDKLEDLKNEKNSINKKIISLQSQMDDMILADADLNPEDLKQFNRLNVKLHFIDEKIKQIEEIEIAASSLCETLEGTLSSTNNFCNAVDKLSVSSIIYNNESKN